MRFLIAPQKIFIMALQHCNKIVAVCLKEIMDFREPLKMARALLVVLHLALIFGLRFSDQGFGSVDLYA